MSKGVILLAAGGTGGHLFPAEALAHELRARGWDVHLATDGRAERFAGRFPAQAIHTVSAATIGSRNPFAMLRAFAAIWRGVRQSSRLIADLKPRVVVGFGGYPTLPPVFAATLRGTPTLIHEQNAVMGRANRMLAGRVTAVAGGFLAEGKGAAASKTIVTGNPVRPAIVEAAEIPFVAPAESEPFRLLVFGGSQGAQFFSQAIPDAIAALADDLRARLSIVQQARRDDEDHVRGAYARLGIEARVAPFFDDMAEHMARAHLVISRAGASTVSEISAIGRPAVLVPYPHALDHDQAANAAALQAAGGAEVHPQATLSPERIARMIADFMRSPQSLGQMAVAARRMGRPDAVLLLGDLVEAIADGKSIDAYRKEHRP